MVKKPLEGGLGDRVPAPIPGTIGVNFQAEKARVERGSKIDISIIDPAAARICPSCTVPRRYALPASQGAKNHDRRR
jgi:hypothetical protein